MIRPPLIAPVLCIYIFPVNFSMLKPELSDILELWEQQYGQAKLKPD